MGHRKEETLEIYHTSGKSEGYINVSLIYHEAIKRNCYIILIIGARGTGKTYGTLAFMEEELDGQYIYLRRKQKHIDMACKPALSPFKDLNCDKEWSLQAFKIPDTDVAEIFSCEIDEKSGKWHPAGELHGMMLSLSTFSDTRSVSFRGVNTIFYDEFVPEKRERIMRDEGYTFNNVLETVGRNRELKGEAPVTAICAANSERIDNALFMYFEIVKDALDMRAKGDNIRFLRHKGICIVDMSNSPISQKKANTFLYAKANKNNRFHDMAINNVYDMESEIKIGKRPLAEYKPLVHVCELCIYQHKSKDEYYACYHVSGTPPRYEYTEISMKRFQLRYPFLLFSIYNDNIIFYDYTSYILLTKYFDKV